MILRRSFITLLGGAAAWPLAAGAQQGNRVRRIGVLMPGDENYPVAKAYLSALTQALADLGWVDGRNRHSWHSGFPAWSWGSILDSGVSRATPCDRDGDEFCPPGSTTSGSCACPATWHRVQAGR